MSKVFVNIGLSLDGYMAPEGMAIENLREPAPRFRIDKVLDSPTATHLRYVRE